MNQNTIVNNIESPLVLRWDELTYQYKVNKPKDQSGEYVALALAERYEKAITSLTPGGSEFVNDPEYCAKHVKEFQASQHRLICELVIEKKKLKEENALLIEALESIVNSYEKSRGLLMITYLHPEYSKAKELLKSVKP